MKLTAAAICLSMCLMAAAYADVTLGLPPNPGTGICDPFGCPYDAEYQQVYNSTDFSSPITITGMDFYNTQSNSYATQTPTGTWDIHLSTTSVNSSTITGDWAANIGPDNTLVFDGNIHRYWAFGDTLFIPFSTPFTYNPRSGNLLLDVVGSEVHNPGGNIFFDTLSGSDLFAQVISLGGVTASVGFVDGYGLTTTFVTAASTVPEPSFLPIIGGALGLLGFTGLARRKQRTRPAQPERHNR